MAKLAERRKDMLNSMMKDGIYEAAVEVLGTYGSEGLTMDRLAETAGIAKGSLYNYFRNKQELILFIHDKTIKPVNNTVDVILDEPIGSDAKLTGMVRCLVEHFYSHRGVFDFLFNDPEVRAVVEPVQRNTCRGKFIGKMTIVFEQGVADGTFRKLVPHRTAEMCFGAMIGTLEQEMIEGENRSSEESVDLLLDLMLKGLELRD
ncbi:MAG: TetR/AcrR family transcriptional regulator [Planctomycetota bacterium]|nr:TetR/AcrR family transcriptional regulator [Planctomycetota bacterium]